MAKLLPIKEIPYHGRAAERAARAKYETRAAALEAAQYEVVGAPGCCQGSFGWLCSRKAALAVSEELTMMPGGTCHSERACPGLRS